MEHDQLINEMGQIERLTTAERLRLARWGTNKHNTHDLTPSFAGNGEGCS
jgi:hypothetical protein